MNLLQSKVKRKQDNFGNKIDKLQECENFFSACQINVICICQRRQFIDNQAITVFSNAGKSSFLAVITEDCSIKKKRKKKLVNIYFRRCHLLSAVTFTFGCVIYFRLCHLLSAVTCLVIHLKRFYGYTDSPSPSYKKKLNYLRFPLQNLALHLRYIVYTPFQIIMVLWRAVIIPLSAKMMHLIIGIYKFDDHMVSSKN
ncbi:uncharacterized protein ACN427_009321 [Glossina fuscipes fuscipes]